MSDEELRVKCVEFAITILEYWTQRPPCPRINHLIVADQIFKYIKNGEFDDAKPILPINWR